MNALSKDDYQKKAKDIFRILNEYRKNPKLLIKHLEMLKKYLDPVSNVLSEPGKIQIQMVEGPKIFDEAINYLRNISSNLSTLELDENLCKSAMEHVMDIGPKGLLSYQSSDGTEPEERISKYGSYIETLGENIDFGPNDANGVIVSLTLDDGEVERPHRDNLFKPEYKRVGIACGPHKTEFQMCVMDFADDFKAMETENIHEETLPGKPNVNFNDQPKAATKNYSAYENPSNKPRQDFDRMETTGSNSINNYVNINEYNQGKPQMNTKPAALVKLDVENEKYNFNELQGKNIDIDDIVKASRELNISMENKKVISKKVEVQTRIIYYYEDGTEREVSDLKTKSFNN